jgi:hypothetical protein
MEAPYAFFDQAIDVCAPLVLAQVLMLRGPVASAG